MSKRKTIADVAKAAGVSMMTVSRVINQKEGVSEATRQRILALAKEMGYSPNGLAQGLASSRTATIGLVVPDISNPFFSEIALGVEDVAYKYQYNVFLLNSSETPERERQAVASLWGKRVDGLILCSSRLPEIELQEILERFSYVVLINRTVSLLPPNAKTVVVDEEAGMGQAVALLAQQGRRQIAFVAGPAHSVSSQRRRTGFLAACQAHGIDVASERIVDCDPTHHGGYMATQTLLKAVPTVDGIVAFNDLVAVGVMEACRQNGRFIPQNVAIIGIDDILLAALVTPSLSTLRINKYGLGEQAMKTLLQLIGTGDNTHIASHAIQPTLVLRHSTP